MYSTFCSDISENLQPIFATSNFPLRMTILSKVTLCNMLHSFIPFSFLHLLFPEFHFIPNILINLCISHVGGSVYASHQALPNLKFNPSLYLYIWQHFPHSFIADSHCFLYSPACLSNQVICEGTYGGFNLYTHRIVKARSCISLIMM